jgi:hypothetical protein
MQLREGDRPFGPLTDFRLPCSTFLGETWREEQRLAVERTDLFLNCEIADRENLMALLRYDPREHVDSDSWLALDESERTGLVVRYHRRQRIRLPNETVHAAIHVIVENQAALGDAFPARAVLFRLMNEGLDRHEAIHAIGAVLSKTLFTAVSGENLDGDLNAGYVEELKSLSAESWRNQAL